TFTPLASWGAAAYSQSHSLALMQSVSLFGLPGLSFLVYWVNAALADLIVHQKISKWNLAIPASLVAVLFVFGSLRYDISKAHGKETMMVAAIGTDSDVGGYPLPSKASNDKVIADMIKRTGKAAALGAKLISWTEGATFVLPEDEPGWTQRVSHLSDSLNIYLVASYIKPLSEKPMRYENKFLFFNPKGQLLGTYYKHEPVPAEPAVQGKAPLEVYDVAGSKVGGVICYDYDFPYLAKGYGRLHADIVADPSSDWRGIDPLHTRMAAYRAIEQGHSILRSTRFGLSASITPFGEFTAQMSSFDQNDKIMIGYLPVKGVRTLYSIIGDLLIYISIGFILFSLFRLGMKKQPDPQ
ncbi:MAG TPA: nitrilase-related carbon-nitrogen hydrolase, partial [Saprospiraceae bacterium]|nr:nitrilase-related carbon-nitrogen hydrolase [Saprospiraceae bacterium]